MSMLSALTAAPSIEEAEALFRAHYPQYDLTQALDALRAREYARLDRGGHIYLDYTGGGLHADSQLAAHQALLRDSVLGNPHSTNPTSNAATALVEHTRARVLAYFNASPDEYGLVFTANASGALKIVGEGYPFGAGGRLLLAFDNHNSVNGIREYAAARGATVEAVPLTRPELRLDPLALEDALERARPGAHHLFAYPAQSNFSGVQHPLELIARAQARGWEVLLDAAAYVPTHRLDLSRVHPDFVSISFYKLFGYPTGIGALLVRKSALAKLRRPYFAGGTVNLVSVQGSRHLLREGAERFEDGTVNYLGIPAIAIGLDHLQSVGVELIGQRVRALTGWLLASLSSLHHANGRPVVALYGPIDGRARGGTISLNFVDAAGRYVDFHDVEPLANQAGISLRTGCFCNPGAAEIALGFSADDLDPCFTTCRDAITCDDLRCCLPDRPSGAVRISLGIASNFADVHHFLQFARCFAEG
jgi:selenocysteine lyase/cysteine desulfurase